MKEKKQGKSRKKRGLRILLYAMATFLSLLILLAIVLKQPAVQSYAARKMSDWISKKTGDRLKIGSVALDFFSGIRITGLDLRDTTGQIMLHTGILKASPAFFKLFSGKFFIRSVKIDTADFRLIVHKHADNYSFIRFINKLSSPDTTASGGVFKLSIKKIDISHLHFQLKNENEQPGGAPPNTMHYNDMEASDGILLAHDFQLINDSISFVLDRLSAREKSGLLLKDMRSRVIISGKLLSFQHTKMITNHSHLDFDYRMITHSWADYGHYIDSVKMEATFRPSLLDMSDIGYFADVMFRMKDNISIDSGRINGPLSRLEGKGLRIAYGKSTRFNGDIKMNGLPDFYSTQIRANIHRFHTSVRDVKAFVIPEKDPNIPVPETIKSGENFSVSGTFDGSFYHFLTDLKMNTSGGGTMKLMLRLQADTAKIQKLKIEAQGHRFPLNNFTGSPLLGNADFNVSMHYKDSLEHPTARISVTIPAFQLNGYTCRNLHYQGSYANDTLLSRLKTDDPHLKLSAEGFTVFQKQPRFHYNVDIHRADFKAFRIWEQKDFHLTSRAILDFSGWQPDSLTGTLTMKKTVLGFGNDRYPIHSILFEKKHTPKKGESMLLHSDLLDAQVNGYYTFSALSKGLSGLPAYYFPSFKKAKSSQITGNDTIRFTLLLKKPEFIGEHFIYGLNISPGTRLSASLGLKNNTLFLDGFARKLVYEGIEARDNQLSIKTKDHFLQVNYDIAHLILRDSTSTDKTVFGLDSLRMKTAMGKDSLRFGIFWHNNDTTWRNKGILEGYYAQQKENKKFHISRSDIYVNDTLWKIDPQNEIIYQNNTWQFHHLKIHGGLSQFALEGRLPENNGDSLSVMFHSWNLSNLDLLWEMLGFDIDGIMNGNILVARRNGRNARMADLSVKHFALNHTYLGNARILSTWNNTDNSAFIKAQVVRSGNAGRAKIIGLSGFYFPYRDTASLDLSMDFKRLKLQAINPFFNDYVSHLEGQASGEMTLKGSVKNPSLEGFVDIHRASLVVNYLNTKYSFHQRITFDKNKINFGKFILYDTLGNQAVLQGEIFHHYFRNMRLNFDINTRKLLFFNTTRHMNNVYYGTAIASGDVKITGPVNDIKMRIDAKTQSGTSVVIPLDYSTEVADKDYIVFVPPPVDSSRIKPEETVLKIPEQQPSKFAISLNLDVRPSADLKIYLPSNMGDILTNGSGLLNMFVNSEGDMKLSGDYVVNKGEFNFSLGNLVRKHFELVKGGRISWAGDPYQATVYLKGLYKLKANLSSLGIVIDSSADYKNRTQVNCYIIMQHDLFNPDIKFQIHFPELDPDMQRMVYAQLDTTNAAVMNQQMISLLVLGSFSFSNAANISWNTSYYTILSNQLSGMLSKISKDFDIGVNYKPGDALTKQEFDVALSTQLFDDRLIINGNFGMTYDKENRSANNIVGDVDIKYKLTKDGRWMLKAYNHSNINSWYYYSNYDKISPYTQGVGIVYRKEFNRLADLFRKRNRKIKKRNQKKKSVSKK